jgi:hypothetical protein
LLGLGFGSLVDKLRSGRFLQIASSVVLLTIFLGFGCRAAERARVSQIYRHEGALIPAGLWLKQNSDPTAVVQLEPLGYIGYYSERVMIDEVGLVTPQMVDLKRRGIFDLEQYVEFFQPDYVLIHCDDSLSIQESDRDHELTTHYIEVASFNPRNFDPREPGIGPNFDNLGRSSCYEIWGRNGVGTP